MSNIKFDFNPLTPVPSGGGKFPWELVLIAAGLFGLLGAIAYAISNPKIKEPSLISDEEKLKSNDQNQQPQQELDSKEVD